MGIEITPFGFLQHLGGKTLSTKLGVYLFLVSLDVFSNDGNFCCVNEEIG